MPNLERKHQSPWGTWEVLDDSSNYKVKRIVVHPGQRLSYQKHSQREEHWTIVQGNALVTLDGKDMILKSGETVIIPKGSLHRIKNIENSTDVIYIEIQLGTYFGEDDIVRIEDDYGRQ